MYNLRLTDKTGFRNITGNPVVILDQRGKPFYDTRNLNHRVWEFNLPAGNYQVAAGKISKRVSPVSFSKMALPEPERSKRGNPEHFDILFAENPNKCTVDWLNRRIIYDNSFREAELPVIVLIYYHECGHRYYKTEEYCDAYAYNCMIDQGYNPSQIGIGFVNSLSERADDRKITLVHNMYHQDFFHKKGDSVFARVNHFEKEMDNIDKSDIEKFFIGDKKFTYSGIDVQVWDKPGGATVLRKVKAGDTIGKIEALNQAGTWGYLRQDQYNPKGGAVYLNDTMHTMLLDVEAPKNVGDAVAREVPKLAGNIADSIFDFLKSMGIVKLIIIVLVIAFLLFLYLPKLQASV